MQEVRVNPAIAAAIGGGIKLPQAATSKPIAPAPVVLPPPPTAPAAQVAFSDHQWIEATTPSGTTSPAGSAGRPAVADLRAVQAPTGSPVAHSSPAAFDAFGEGMGRLQEAGHGGFAWSTDCAPTISFSPPTQITAGLGSSDAFAPPTKPGASPGTISLTASAHATGQQALPVYLFAEPTPPAYSTAAAGWGAHVGGMAPSALPAGGSPVRTHGSPASKPAVAAAPAEELFSDFSPFK